VRDLADELLQAKVKTRLAGGDHAPRLGRLVILDRLGAGAMGTVFAAYDPKLDRRVAVKVLHATDADASARVLREARALAKLAHPNIVAIHDTGEDAGAVFVVMELATGVPLRAWIDNPERTWRDVVRVMTDVAAGLAAAHRAGLVHRDIKPENILVGEDRARLVDFGLALEPTTIDLAHSDVVREPAATKPDPHGATDLASLGDGGAGTPSYMAPEVLDGGASTAASDQFSFAVTLFEALHGERSHGGSTRAELHAAAMQAANTPRTNSPVTRNLRFPEEVRTPDLRSKRKPETVLSAQAPTPSRRRGIAVEAVPAWVDAIVRRALAAKPEDRFPSMTALHAELVRDRTRRRRRAFAIAGVALIAGGAIGVLAYRAKRPAPPPAAQVSCDGQSRVDEVWNPRSQARIRERIGDAPWSNLMFERLGVQAKAWHDSFRTVCEATRVRGEQSDRLLELRMRCLDRTLGRFDAFAGALQAQLDPSGLIEAASSVQQLPVAKTCEALLEDPTLAVPSDPAQRAEAEAIERELDHAWAAYAVGRYAAARTQASNLSHRVSKLELPALHASVLIIGGAIEARIGEGHRARKLYEHAAVLAAHAKAPELELEIVTRMLRQDLFHGDHRRVIDWGAIGEATAIRVGKQGAEVSSIIGEALREGHHLVEARERLTAALSSTDPLRDDQRALIEMNLASIDLALGKAEAATAAYQRAYDRARVALGEGHPTLAIHLDRLAEAARARGKLRDALALHDRSRELRERAFGPEDRSVATARFHRAETLLEAGRLADAEADATAARTLRVKVWGKESSRLAEIDVLLADIALARGQLEVARKLYQGAAALDDNLLPSRRLVGLVGSLGVRASASPTGPLDSARFRTAAATIGLQLGSLRFSLMIEEANKLEPFSVERVADNAARLSLLSREHTLPLLAKMIARYRAGGPVDAAISLAVADAALAVADRPTAAVIYAAALAALTDEPSRARLHAYRGLVLAADGDAATTARAAADGLAKAMPELAP
jgi:serine/threonine protein kinase/tetratricopeptide (TPR) repeat protein